MMCTLHSQPRTGNRVEPSAHRFLAEGSDKRLSTRYLRPNIQPIYQVLLRECAFYIHGPECKRVCTLRHFMCRGFPYETSITCKKAGEFSVKRRILRSITLSRY